jgi:hypothetical protein
MLFELSFDLERNQTILSYHFRNSLDENAANQDKLPTVLRNLKNIEAKEGALVQFDLFAVGQPQPEVCIFFFQFNI